MLCFLFLALSSVPAWADYYPSAYRIPVNPITPLHKQSKDAIFSLRKVKVNDHGKLGIFPDQYMPAPSIYGHVDEKADWVRDTQFFVGNPYLLAVITSGNKVNAFLPYCNVDSVEYSYGKITETYRGSPQRSGSTLRLTITANSRGSSVSGSSTPMTQGSSMPVSIRRNPSILI